MPWAPLRAVRQRAAVHPARQKADRISPARPFTPRTGDSRPRMGGGAGIANGKSLYEGHGAHRYAAYPKWRSSMPWCAMGNGQAWLCAKVEWLNETYFDSSAVSSCPKAADPKRRNGWPAASVRPHEGSESRPASDQDRAGQALARDARTRCAPMPSQGTAALITWSCKKRAPCFIHPRRCLQFGR
jgi:hypothetical protein